MFTVPGFRYKNINLFQIKKVSENVADNKHRIKLWLLGLKCWLHYQLNQTLRTLLAVLAYISAFCLLVLMNICTFRLAKYTLWSQETQPLFGASPVLNDTYS